MIPIKGYEGLYWADESGRIWACAKRKWSERFLRTWLIGNGYEMVMLYKNKRPKKFLVHRLIAEAFVPNRQNLPQVNHIDGDRRNNKPENLEWVSDRENKRHAWRNGLYKRPGKRHWLAYMTDKQALKAIQLVREGIPQNQVAARFHIHPMSISLLVRHKIYKHLFTS